MVHDNIYPCLLRSARFVVVPYPKLFLNYVFTQGLFDNNCKIARVNPIHKSMTTFILVFLDQPDSLLLRIQNYF